MFKSVLLALFTTLLLASCVERNQQEFTFDYDCSNPLLQSKLFNENFGEKELVALISNLKTLNNCGLDSIDLAIMTEGQILGSLIISMGNPETKNEGSTSTYADLIRAYEGFADKVDYVELRQIKTITQTLSTLKIDYNQWDNHIKYFQQLGMPAENIEELRQSVKKNQGRDITYTELNAEIENKVNNKVIKNRLKNLSRDEIIKLNNETNKNILILFSAGGSPNSIRFEEFILTNPQIIDVINANFQLIELNCEDRSKLPAADIYISKNEEITTYGERNMDFQMSEFQSNTFPLLIRVDSAGNFNAQDGYTGLNNLLEFLHN